MSHSYQSSILQVNHKNETLPLGAFTITEEDSDFTITMSSEIKTHILRTLKDHVVILKNVIPKNQIVHLLNQAKKFLTSQPQNLPFTQTNWQFVERWVHIRKPQVRTSLSVYPPYPDLNAIEKVGRLIVRLRNVIHDWPLNVAIDPQYGETASINMSHYPSGGGFMVEHRDVDDEGTVCTLSLTERHKDYTRGGVYARTDDGDFIDADQHIKTGDVYLVRANLRHGVANIDPEKALEIKNYDIGRWILFAPLQGYNDKNPVLIA